MAFKNRWVGDNLVVTISNKDLDSSVATAFKEHLIDAFEGNPDRIVILDVSKVRFFDSSCLGALFAAFRQTGSNAKVVLAGAKESVEQVFEVARVSKVMPIVRSLDQATQITSAEWPLAAG